MNGSILVDTNVLIKLLGGESSVLPILENANINISAITEIEILSYTYSKQELEKVKYLLENCIVLDTLNSEIRKQSANYRKQKMIKKIPDAIIAATAKYYNLPLFTFDNDFKSVNNIDVIIL